MQTDYVSYRRLATEMFRQASDEFAARYSCRVTKKSLKNEKRGHMQDRLFRLQKRIDAGRFLLNRTDPVCHMWAAWLDCELGSFRDTIIRGNPNWPQMLVDMEQEAMRIRRHLYSPMRLTH